MRTFRKGGAILLAIALAFAAHGNPARAEETPIQVPLSYIINLSNTGSPTAVGTAEVWQHEAEVRLSAQNLTPLPAGSIYAVWLVDPQAGHFLAVGRFNVSHDGTAVLDVSLPGSLATSYSMVLVTLQPDPDPHRTVPSNKYVIEGFFPGNTAVQHQVKYLPDTGQYAQHPSFETTITPDAPASTPATNPLLGFALLALAFLSFGYVARRMAQQKGSLHHVTRHLHRNGRHGHRNVGN
jgi:hypothetical protein